MASCGTGVATGKLHEMTDITMAADWEKTKFHFVAFQPDLEKESSFVSHESQTTIEKDDMKVKDGSEELNDDNKKDLGADVDVHTGKNEEEMAELEPLQTCNDTEGVLKTNPNSIVNDEEQKVNTDDDANQTEKEVTHQELSEDIVTAFEKEVQCKDKVQPDEQSQSPKTPYRSSSSELELKPDKVTMARTDVIMATYTSSKNIKEITEMHNDKLPVNDDSHFPASRQTTSSSADARSDTTSHRSLNKPDSGYSRRHHRRRQEDTRSNYSKHQENSEEEQFGDQKQESKEPFYRQNDDYLNDRFQSPRQPYDNATAQKALLELMTKGLGTFTEQMADVMIDKLRPEYETLSRKVATEVQESTMFELNELRTKVINAQKALKELEKDKENLKKHLEAEKNKRLKETEEKEAHIKKLEKDLDQCKNSVKERDRVLKKAEHRAKMEEQKRIQLEQEYQDQCTNLKRLLDRAKGDLLVYRSKKRVALTVEKQEAVAAVNRLNSHH